MNAQTLTERLRLLVPASKPVLLVGPPGVGKTDICHQTAQALGMDLWVGHPAVSDPTDYKGLPALVDGRAEWLPYGDLRVLLEAKRPTLALLDDLGQAPHGVQAAVMQLLGARRVNGHCLPPEVVFIAATNRRQDKAGVSGLLEPVKSRFSTILHVEPDMESWSSWALSAGVSQEVISFLRFRPALLSDFQPTADITNSPCPRTWARAGELVALGINDLESLSGCVGEGAARELVAFLAVWRKLPDPDAVMMNPDTAPVPTDPATLYAIVGALIARTTANSAGRVITYACRLPEAHNVLLVRSAERTCAATTSTPEFKKWAAKYGAALV